MQTCDYLFMKKLSLLAIISWPIMKTRAFRVSPAACLMHHSLFMMHKLQSTLCTASRVRDVLIQHLRRPTITSSLIRGHSQDGPSTTAHQYHPKEEASRKKITFSCWTSFAVASDVVPANQINPQRDSHFSSVWSDSCSGSHTSFSVHVYKIVDKHVEMRASFKNSPTKSGLWKPTPLQLHLSCPCNKLQYPHCLFSRVLY